MKTDSKSVLTILALNQDKAKVIGDSDAQVKEGVASFENIAFITQPGS